MGRSKTVVFSPLPAPVRFYIYAIQGFCDEILFTALYEFVLNGDWTLKGHSAISSFFIYGTCSFTVESLYIFLYYKHGVPWYIRQPLYVLIAYTWEFTTGFILRQFDACPWDYSHYKYNFMGLITLEYALGWLFLAFCQDALADYLLRARLAPPGDVSPYYTPPSPVKETKYQAVPSSGSRTNYVPAADMDVQKYSAMNGVAKSNGLKTE